MPIFDVAIGIMSEGDMPDSRQVYVAQTCRNVGRLNGLRGGVAINECFDLAAR